MIQQITQDSLASLRKLLGFSSEMSSSEFNIRLNELIETLKGKSIRGVDDRRAFFKKLTYLHAVSCNKTLSPRLIELMVKEICADYFNCFSLEDPQANHVAPGVKEIREEELQDG